MLNITGINSVGIQPGQIGMSQSTDHAGKAIQEQIEYLQKQLDELSADETMDWQEKQQKQQELQMQINDLTAQLRQRQMEQKKEKLQEAGVLGKNEDPEQKSMQALLSARTSADHAEIQGHVSERLKGRAKVLASEISLDAGRQGSSEGKKQELLDVKQRALNAGSSQMGLLGKAGRILKEDTEENMDKLKEKDTENKTSDTEDKKSDAIIYTNEGKPSPGEILHKITVRA